MQPACCVLGCIAIVAAVVWYERRQIHKCKQAYKAPAPRPEKRRDVPGPPPWSGRGDDAGTHL